MSICNEIAGRNFDGPFRQSIVLSCQGGRQDNLKPLKYRKHDRYRGSCPSVATRNGDCSTMAFNQVLYKRESYSG